MSYPFTQPAANSHSGFTPMKLTNVIVPNSGGGDSSRPTKPPKPPEKPLMPYMRYSRKMWDKVRAQNTDSKLWDIGKIIGQMWRELPDSQKQLYSEEYEIEKVEYEKAMKLYHNSPAYQSYLQHKSSGSTTEKGSKQKPTPQADIGVYIQPVEEEDGSDGQLSTKQIAGARFQRNHRLIAEIFSRSVIPDLRTVVTSSRMNILKRQVHSLTMHQQKLESELQVLEEKFEAKKRKITESSQDFLKKYDELSEQKPVIDEEFMKRAVEAQTERLKTAYAAYQKTQLELRAKIEAAQEQVFAVPTVPTAAVSATVDIPAPMETSSEELKADETVAEEVATDVNEVGNEQKEQPPTAVSEPQAEDAVAADSAKTEAEPVGDVADKTEADETVEKSEEEDNNDDDDESFEMSTDADEESKDGY